jgi:hypothetical protein
MQSQDHYAYLGSLAVISFVFLFIPYSLYLLGVSLFDDLALTILSAGILIDIFTTKIGFNRGFGECNIFYNAAKKKGKNNAFLIGVLVSCTIRASFVMLFWQDAFILLLVAMVSLVAPLWNSILLSRRDQVSETPKIAGEIST